MINLLPVKEKEILRLEQTKKLAVILGITILSFIICLSFVLLSIYFFALGEVNSKNFYLQQATKEYQSPDSITLKAVIQKYNKLMPQVYAFYSTKKSFRDALDIIYAIPKPNGLFFSNLSLDIAKQGAANKGGLFVSITGTSLTRDAIIDYQDSLGKEAKIKGVSFSPQSWINSENINFGVTFYLSNNE